MPPFLERLLESFAHRIGIPAGVLPRIAESVVVILVVALLARLARRTARRLVHSSSALQTTLAAVNYGAGVLVVLVLAKIWFEGISGLATYLGLVSAGLAVSLKDPVANLVGWLVIVLRHPFAIGDRVEIAGQRGDVLSIRLFVTKLREVGKGAGAEQPTGRVVSIPNSALFTQPYTTYVLSDAYIWTEIPFTVAFESDLLEAQAILLQTVADHGPRLDADTRQEIEQAASDHFMETGDPSPTLWTSLAPEGVVLTLRFMCPARELRRWTSVVTLEGCRAISASSAVRLAYPTTRLTVEAASLGR